MGLLHWVVAVGMVLGAACAQGTLVAQEISPIFKVEEFWAEDLNVEQRAGDRFFEASIYQMPLVERRRPVPMVAPPPVGSGIEMMPSSSRAQESLRAAEAYAAAQDWKMALAAIQTALEDQPNNLLVLRRAAAFAALAKKFGVADEYFRRALEISPNDVQLLAARAGVLLRLMRLREAEAVAERALQIQPRFLMARFVRTCAQVAQGAEVLKDADWSDLFLDQLADVIRWLHADRADYEAVLTTKGFETVCDLMIAKGSSSLLLDLIKLTSQAIIALQRQKWAEASALLRQLQDAGIRALGVRMDLARCEFEQGQQKEAAEKLAELAREYPHIPVLHFNYAVSLIRLRQFSGAVTALEKALQLDPASQYARFALACAYVGLGDKDRAFKVLEDISPEARALVGEWAKGEDDYLKALREDPRFSEYMKTATP